MFDSALDTTVTQTASNSSAAEQLTQMLAHSQCYVKRIGAANRTSTGNCTSAGTSINARHTAPGAKFQLASQITPQIKPQLKKRIRTLPQKVISQQPVIAVA